MGMIIVINESRNLGIFHIRALCSWCGGAQEVCLPSPCCHAINCDIPGLLASVVRNVGVGEMGRFNWGFDKLGGVVTL